MRHFALITTTVLIIGVSWAIAQNLKTSPTAVDALKKMNSLELQAKANAEAQVISQAPRQPIEIGLVRWGRNLEAARKQSSESGKPILLLFQEVPG